MEAGEGNQQVKINAHLIDFNFNKTSDHGAISGEMTFEMRLRRESKNGSGETIAMTMTIPEWNSTIMAREIRKAVKELVEIRERALVGAKELETEFKTEANK